MSASICTLVSRPRRAKKVLRPRRIEQRQQPERILRERVTYMLWVMANKVD